MSWKGRGRAVAVRCGLISVVELVRDRVDVTCLCGASCRIDYE